MSESIHDRIEAAYDELSEAATEAETATMRLKIRAQEIEASNREYLAEEGTNERKYKAALMELIEGDEDYPNLRTAEHAASTRLRSCRFEVDKLTVLAKLYVADKNVEAAKIAAGKE